MRSRTIRPGVTMRCSIVYPVNPDGGPARLELSDWWDGDEDTCVMAEYEYSDSLTTDVWDWDWETYSDPSWTSSKCDWEGKYEDLYVNVDTAESTESYGGDELIRVYIVITNNGADPVEAEDFLSVSAFQDGIGLNTGWPDEEVTEDGNDDREIRTGESLTVAYCFELISDSPIEIEAECGWDDVFFGGVFRSN